VSGGGVAKRISIWLSVLTIVAAIIGFVVSLILNAFVLGKYNAYGEVPIPGTTSLQLPAGEVTVSFHTVTIGSPSGGGLPVPQLGIAFDPPDGVPQPKVTENWGTTTTVNNDTHIRVWVVQIPAAGTYTVKAEGQVNGYISPQLAFGRESPLASLPWVFAALFGLAILNLICIAWWSARKNRRNAAVEQPFSPDVPINLGAQPQPVFQPQAPAAPPQPAPLPHPPGDEGIKLEQLKTLASLRESGALTEAEFETEKRRILEGR
jgi:hypothetical protein